MLTCLEMIASHGARARTHWPISSRALLTLCVCALRVILQEFGVKVQSGVFHLGTNKVACRGEQSSEVKGKGQALHDKGFSEEQLAAHKMIILIHEFNKMHINK